MFFVVVHPGLNRLLLDRMSSFLAERNSFDKTTAAAGSKA